MDLGSPCRTAAAPALPVRLFGCHVARQQHQLLPFPGALVLAGTGWHSTAAGYLQHGRSLHTLRAASRPPPFYGFADSPRFWTSSLRRWRFVTFNNTLRLAVRTVYLLIGRDTLPAPAHDYNSTVLAT